MDSFEADALEVKCLHPTSSKLEMCMQSVGNLVYYKLSHGATFYSANKKNVNVELESNVI